MCGIITQKMTNSSGKSNILNCCTVMAISHFNISVIFNLKAFLETLKSSSIQWNQETHVQVDRFPQKKQAEFRLKAENCHPCLLPWLHDHIHWRSDLMNGGITSTLRDYWRNALFILHNHCYNRRNYAMTWLVCSTAPPGKSQSSANKSGT